VLQVSDIVVTFGGIRALNGVSLGIGPAEIRGLIGPNGSGKTTLFDVISGVRRQDSGRVLFRGEDVTATTTTHRARAGLRRTFQRTQVFGRLTVAENLLFALEWRGGGGGLFADVFRLPGRRRLEQERMDRVMRLLELCALTEVADTAAGALPIGIARRVEFARAVIDDPVLLLLDEPTSGLDGSESERLGELIELFSGHHHRCAILLVEHDVGFVMQRCSRVSVLHMGELIAEGSPEEIQESDRVRAVYFDMP
jgi:branched-chain amino acid transport system ATP-binding protein